MATVSSNEATGLTTSFFQEIDHDTTLFVVPLHTIVHILWTLSITGIGLFVDVPPTVLLEGSRSPI